MEQHEFPTKGNLIHTRHTLTLARQGYLLLDQKRNALMLELASLKKEMKVLKKRMSKALDTAKATLIKANIEMGTSLVQKVAADIPQENTVQVHTRSIMGAEVYKVIYENSTGQEPKYSLSDTSCSLDEAANQFSEVKSIIVALAAVEHASYRIGLHVRKTQKRANALQYIIIPRYERRFKFIQEVLEERERDGFVRLKMGVR